MGPDAVSVCVRTENYSGREGLPASICSKWQLMSVWGAGVDLTTSQASERIYVVIIQHEKLKLNCGFLSLAPVAICPPACLSVSPSLPSTVHMLQINLSETLKEKIKLKQLSSSLYLRS